MTYSARVLADSVAPNGKRLTTFEVVMPKFVQAELNTHRMLSRNSASSRAIPIEKFIEQVKKNPVLPVWWGKNQSGMQAREELSDNETAQDLHDVFGWLPDIPAPRDRARNEWLSARDNAVESAQWLSEIGLHKQIVNRLLEPWIFTTVIVSATEWDNFFKLRCHPDAQPELRHVAVMMRDAREASTPVKMHHESDRRHLPLISAEEQAEMRFAGFSLTDICDVSVGRCARVSYLTHDGKRDWQADISLAKKLAESGHWSPFEHVAAPRAAAVRIGNFIGWEQYRAKVDPDFLW